MIRRPVENHSPADASQFCRGACWNDGRLIAILFTMTEVTRLLHSIEQGDPSASDELLPLVYNELRRLAAAEAMRRILVERARRQKAEKHGGHLARVELSAHALLCQSDPGEILALNDALDVLAKEEAEAAELVKLRIFADFSVEEAGQLLGMSRATAYRHWTRPQYWNTL